MRNNIKKAPSKLFKCNQIFYSTISSFVLVDFAGDNGISPINKIKHPSQSSSIINISNKNINTYNINVKKQPEKITGNEN